MTSKRRIVVSACGLVVAFAAACGGGGGDSLEGTYVHEEEGTLEVLEDGEATLTQSGAPVELTYEVDGDSVTFDADGSTVTAEIDGDDLVFEDEAFSGEGTTTFTKQG